MNRFNLIWLLILFCVPCAWGQSAPDRQNHRLVVQDGHSGIIRAMAVHPFLNRLATVDDSGELVVWDMESRMLLEKHKPGYRAAAAGTIRYGSNGRFIIFNSFRKDLQDLARTSNGEVFTYNLAEERKYSLAGLNEFSDYDSTAYFAAANRLYDPGSGGYYVATGADVGRMRKDPALQGENRVVSFGEPVTDLDSDPSSGTVAVTFRSGRIEVMTQELDSLWSVGSESGAGSFRAAVRETRIIGGRYLGYLRDRNRGTGGGSPAWDLVIRNLRSGEPVFRTDVSAASFPQFQRLAASRDGRYAAVNRNDSLLVADLERGEVVWHGMLPPDRNRVYAPIRSLAFLGDSHEIALSAGNALLTFDPVRQAWSPSFNRTLRPEYGGEVMFAGTDRFVLFNRRESTLDIYSLGSLGRQSWDASFFHSLLERTRVRGRQFRLPMERYGTWGAIGDFTVFDADDRELSLWVVSRQDSTQHRILTFRVDNWEVSHVSDPFPARESRYGSRRELIRYDREHRQVYLGDSFTTDGITRRFTLSVTDIGSGREVLNRVQVSHLFFSPGGSWWGYLEGDRKLRVHRAGSLRPVLEKVLETGGAPTGADPLFHPSGDRLFHAAYGRRDSAATAAIVSVDLQTGEADTVLDLHRVMPRALEVSGDDLMVGVDLDFSEAARQDPDSLQRLMEIHGPDYLLSPRILVADRRTGTIRRQIPVPGTRSPVTAIRAAGNFILAVPQGEAIQIHRRDSSAPPLFHYQTGDASLFTDRQYYTASRELVPKIGLRTGSRVYRVREFDYIFNRPDLLIEQLDAYLPAELEAYRMAVEKRRRIGGIDEETVERMLAAEELPSVRLANRKDIPQVTDEPVLDLQLEASGGSEPLAGWTLRVNGVPIADRPLSPDGEADWEYPVELGEGTNEIEVSVAGAGGLASAPVHLTVEYEPEEERAPDLYIVTIGVSEYRDEIYNLRYADKDAADLQSAFSLRDTTWWSDYDRGAAYSDSAAAAPRFSVHDRYPGREAWYNRIHRLQVTNERVTRSVREEIGRFLQDAGVDDVVVVFLAGHGMIDSEGEYWFATHDIDFSSPAGRGLSYTEIRSVFAEISSRKRVLFMDTCHSGDLDPDLEPEPQLVTQLSDSSRVSTNLARNVGTLQPGPESSWDPYRLMKELFTDLQATGVNVISAASATGFAYETPTVANGVFTHAMIEGLGGRADSDFSGGITVGELREHIFDTVEQMTSGRQQPTSREENLRFDFRIW